MESLSVFTAQPAEMRMGPCSVTSAVSPALNILKLISCAKLNVFPPQGCVAVHSIQSSFSLSYLGTLGLYKFVFVII
jgi:hypothetical protein